MTGDLAVQCFYIISGFYMTLILNEKYVGHNSNILFYTNRALKIYPIYFSVLTLLVVWAVFVFEKGYPGTLSFYSDYWPLPASTLIYLIFVNLFLIGLDSIFFFGIDKGGRMFYTNDINRQTPYLVQFAFNSFAWTIGVELFFYLIAPFVVRKGIKWIVVILILSLFARIYCTIIGLTYSPWTYIFLPNQLMFFMGGALSYYIYKNIKNASVSKTKMKSLFILFVSVLILYNQILDESYLKQSVLFILEVLSIPYIFILTKNYKIDRFLGNLSFPIYLSQALILRITVAKSFPKIMGLGFTTLIITISLSILLDLLVAKPIEKYRQRRVSFKFKTI